MKIIDSLAGLFVQSSKPNEPLPEPSVNPGIWLGCPIGCKEYLHRIAIDPEERARALPEEKRRLAEAAARRQR